MRRLAVCVLGVVVLGGCLFVGVDTAEAYSEPNPITLPENRPQLYEWLRNGFPTQPEKPLPETSAGKTARFRATRWVKLIPKSAALGAAGNLVLQAAAFSAGWKIGTTINTRWLHFNMDEQVGEQYTSGTGYAIRNLTWFYGTVGSFTGWVLRFDTTVSGSPVTAQSNFATECVEDPSPGLCSDANNYYFHWGTEVETALAAAGVSIGTKIAYADGCGAYATEDTDCGFIGATEAEMDAAMNADTFTTWTNQSPDYTTGGYSPAAQSILTESDWDEAVGALESDVPTAEAIGCMIDPQWCETEFGVNPEPEPLALPQPLPGETAWAYRQRLRTVGFLGTITVVDADVPLPTLDAPAEWAAKEPVRIKIGSPVIETVEISEPWPWDGETPAPEYAVDTPIEIEKVPDSEAPPREPDAPSEAFPPGIPPPPGSGGGVCNCPAVNFDPLLDLDYGSNFPFGVFTWLGDSWTSMTSGDPECLSGDFAKPSALGAGTVTVALCSSDWEETYRDPLFLVIEFVMTVGMILWFSLKVLGLGGGDD